MFSGITSMPSSALDRQLPRSPGFQKAIDGTASSLPWVSEGYRRYSFLVRLGLRGFA
jgi:hypothetical protein